MYDFIIVGAGVTGIELSALLAHDGYKVLLLGTTDKIGGRAHLWKKDGWTVEYGIHLIRFGPESAISKICKHLGHNIKFVSPGKSFLKDEDGRIKLFPTGPGGFLRSEMFTFMERLKAIAIMLKIKKSSFESLMSTPLKKWMNDNGLQGGLRRYFTLVSASMMVCPFIERTSTGEMLLNIRKVLKSGYSVMYPEAGWSPLFNLYIEKIKYNGDLRTKSKVDSIIISEEKGTLLTRLNYSSPL